jgi:hypothetical protein
MLLRIRYLIRRSITKRRTFCCRAPVSRKANACTQLILARTVSCIIIFPWLGTGIWNTIMMFWQPWARDITPGYQRVGKHVASFFRTHPVDVGSMFLRNYVGSLSTMAQVETFLTFIQELLESNSSWNTDYPVFPWFYSAPSNECRNRTLILATAAFFHFYFYQLLITLPFDALQQSYTTFLKS